MSTTTVDGPSTSKPKSAASSVASKKSRPVSAASKKSLVSSKSSLRNSTASVRDGEIPPQNHVAWQDQDSEKNKRGCWSSCVHKIWRTRLTEDTKANKDLYIRTTLRELIVYCIFLIVLMILSFGMTSSSMFYYTRVMTELFMDKITDSTPEVSFKTIKSTADWWRATKEPFIAGLYWDAWYNELNYTDAREKNFIFYENKLLGVPRLRQVRVRPNSCTIPKHFRSVINHCFGMYSSSNEDKSPFGIGNSSAWYYSSKAEIGGRSHSGQISDYNAGGYYIDLSRDRDTTVEILTSLFKDLWLDRATRATFIDFTLYNANLNLFCVIKIITEFSAMGGALPHWEFRTVKLLRYVKPMDYFIMACEGIFMLFILYYIIEELIEIKRHKLKYFTSFWNWLDIIVITISIVCAAFNVYRTMTVGKKLSMLLADEDRYPDFDFLSYWQQHFNHAIAIGVFFAWVKIFKYISFNKTMTQLSSTLGACATSLLSFSVMFFLMFFAFAQLGYLLFGTKVEDFRLFQHAVFTLFRIILGDFDFNALQTAHSLLGPLYFLIYVFFVFFILINMFLAIINDTYSDVKGDLETQENDFEISDFLQQHAGGLMSKLSFKRNKVIAIQEVLAKADIDKDNKVDLMELRKTMKNNGYADVEIEALFDKYDLDGDRILDEDEIRKMQMDLQGEKEELEEAMEEEKEKDEDEEANPNEVSEDQFSTLSHRVDNLEIKLTNVVEKIDTVLTSLDTLEREKIQRRAMLRQLLESLSHMKVDKKIAEMLMAWDQKDTYEEN